MDEYPANGDEASDSSAPPAGDQPPLDDRAPLEALEPLPPSQTAPLPTPERPTQSPVQPAAASDPVVPPVWGGPPSAARPPAPPIPPMPPTGSTPPPASPAPPTASPTASPAGATWSAANEGGAFGAFGAGHGAATPPYGTSAPPVVGHDAATPPPYGPGATAPGGPGEPTIPSAAWAPMPAPERGPRRERTGVKAAFIGGVVGALVGALAAGGIVAAVDDHPTRTIIENSSGNSPTRPASVIQTPGDIQSILEKVKPAVVRINVTVDGGFTGSERGVGTGFIISSDGYIVTNAHVAGDASSIQVQLENGRVVPGKLIGAATQSDLAVVKIDGKNLPTAELGDSDSLQVGDQVVAIGNALGLEGEPTVTSGIVSGLNRVLQEPNNVDIANTIQTDAAINPGNSGGPLVDANGRVIGINTAIANPSESNNIGFAIAITPAKNIIDALRKGESPKVAFLGVGTEPVTSDLVQERNLKVDQGAYVSSVSAGSAAADAGIKTGDVIVEVDGDRVTSSEDVINDVRRHVPGDTITVTVNRSGSERSFDITLRGRSTS
jgi:S1-C subfamily serine protease